MDSCYDGFQSAFAKLNQYLKKRKPGRPKKQSQVVKKRKPRRRRKIRLRRRGRLANVNRLAFIKHLLTCGTGRKSCFCGKAFHLCHPTRTREAPFRPYKPWETAPTDGFSIMSRQGYTDRVILRHSLRQLAAMFHLQMDTRDALRCLVHVLQIGPGKAKDGRKQTRDYVVKLAIFFEQIAEFVEIENGKTVMTMCRRALYSDLQDYMKQGLEQNDSVKSLDSCMEILISRCLLELGMTEFTYQHMQASCARGEIELNPNLLWSWVKASVDKPLEIRVSLFIEAIKQRVDYISQAKDYEIVELFTYCCMNKQHWMAVGIVSTLLQPFQGNLTLHRICLFSLLKLWRISCQSLNHGEGGVVYRFKQWVSHHLNKQARFLFRAGGDIYDLVILVPPRRPYQQHHDTTMNSISPLDIDTQMECCAEYIERHPSDTAAWILLSHILCDSEVSVRNSVQKVWAPPRCNVWASLFYAPPLLSLPDPLAGQSLCALRIIILLFVHFPNGKGEELKCLLERCVRSQRRSLENVGTTNFVNSFQEVPGLVLHACLRQALRSGGSDCSELKIPGVEIILHESIVLD